MTTNNLKITNNRWFIFKRLTKEELQETGFPEYVAINIASQLENMKTFPVEVISI